jgi:hypothetical protein
LENGQVKSALKNSLPKKIFSTVPKRNHAQPSRFARRLFAAART